MRLEGPASAAHGQFRYRGALKVVIRHGCGNRQPFRGPLKVLCSISGTLLGFRARSMIFSSLPQQADRIKSTTTLISKVCPLKEKVRAVAVHLDVGTLDPQLLRGAVEVPPVPQFFSVLPRHGVGC